MRVRAFSLIELIVVILLLGIMFSLALNTLNFKSKISGDSDIKNLAKYIDKTASKEDTAFYIYGDKCDKNSFVSVGRVHEGSESFDFKKNYKVLDTDINGILKSILFSPIEIGKKRRHVCLKLNLKRKKFTDKLIVDTGKKYILFAPLYQKITSQDTFEMAKKVYFQNDMFPKSADDYYR